MFRIQQTLLYQSTTLHALRDRRETLSGTGRRGTARRIKTRRRRSKGLSTSLKSSQALGIHCHTATLLYEQGDPYIMM